MFMQKSFNMEKIIILCRPLQFIETPLIDRLKINTWNWTIHLRFEPRNDTKFFKTQIWFDINPFIQIDNESKNYTSQLRIDNFNITGNIPFLNNSALNNLFNEKVQNQTATVLKVQTINPTKIIATVNATKPFVLATSYVLDDSWVAIVNGQQIKPSPLYLGLRGVSN